MYEAPQECRSMRVLHRVDFSFSCSRSNQIPSTMACTLASLRQAPASEDVSNRTTSPIVTGSSVLAIKYADGVMMMSDTLGSYGSLARFKNLERLKAVNEHTLIGAGGEYSDFQAIQKMLENISIEDRCADDGSTLDPSEIHAYLSRVMYGRRSKGDPLWNQVVVAGVKNGNTFLGSVDLYGTTYIENMLATGFGMHMAVPLLRKNWRADMNELEARTLLEDCMRVLYYRDARTINKFQMAKVTAGGIQILPAFSLDTEWSLKLFQRPQGGQA